MDPMNVPAKFEVRSFSCAWDNSGYLKTLVNPWIRRSRSPKVVDFGTNRKRICDFLLVRNSNLGPILHRFGDMAGFLRSRVTQPLFDHDFGGVPVAPDSKNSNLCDHGTWTSHTDRRTIYCGITVLCVASRGKNVYIDMGLSSLCSLHSVYRVDQKVSLIISAITLSTASQFS